MLGEDEGATKQSARLGEGNSMELNGEGREINASPLPKIPSCCMVPDWFLRLGRIDFTRCPSVCVIITSLMAYAHQKARGMIRSSSTSTKRIPHP